MLFRETGKEMMKAVLWKRLDVSQKFLKSITTTFSIITTREMQYMQGTVPLPEVKSSIQRQIMEQNILTVQLVWFQR